MSKFRTILNGLIIKDDSPASITAGGIALVTSAPIISGVVVEAGPGHVDHGVFVENPVKVGDHIMFREDAGTKLCINGEMYRIMTANQIQVILED